MPRVARIIVPGVPHHVTQRGNNRQDVFFTDDDRETYLHVLASQATRHGLSIYAYCLMSNHVHLVVVPVGETSLAKGVGRTNFVYTQYLHALHESSGHLWQNRFFSCALEEGHCWAAMRYVECNPVRAGLVRHACQYPWSSAAAHCGEGHDGLLDMGAWRKAWDAERWREWVAQVSIGAELETLRQHTHGGRPLGSDAFLSRVEVALGHRVRALPVGRPKRQK